MRGMPQPGNASLSASFSDNETDTLEYKWVPGLTLADPVKQAESFMAASYNPRLVIRAGWIFLSGRKVRIQVFRKGTTLFI